MVQSLKMNSRKKVSNYQYLCIMVDGHDNIVVVLNLQAWNSLHAVCQILKTLSLSGTHTLRPWVKQDFQLRFACPYYYYNIKIPPNSGIY